MSATEIMEHTLYQKVNEAKSGPLSLDRVTTDGPRDLVEDAQHRAKNAPLYDLSAKPATQPDVSLEVER